MEATQYRTASGRQDEATLTAKQQRELTMTKCSDEIGAR